MSTENQLGKELNKWREEKKKKKASFTKSQWCQQALEISAKCEISPDKPQKLLWTFKKVIKYCLDTPISICTHLAGEQYSQTQYFFSLKGKCENVFLTLCYSECPIMVIITSFNAERWISYIQKSSFSELDVLCILQSTDT